jgi:hypothetical protein
VRAGTDDAAMFAAARVTAAAASPIAADTPTPAALAVAAMTVENARQDAVVVASSPDAVVAASYGVAAVATAGMVVWSSRGHRVHVEVDDVPCCGIDPVPVLSDVGDRRRAGPYLLV